MVAFIRDNKPDTAVQSLALARREHCIVQKTYKSAGTCIQGISLLVNDTQYE